MRVEETGPCLLRELYTSPKRPQIELKNGSGPQMGSGGPLPHPCILSFLQTQLPTPFGRLDYNPMVTHLCAWLGFKSHENGSFPCIPTPAQA